MFFDTVPKALKFKIGAVGKTAVGATQAHAHHSGNRRRERARRARRREERRREAPPAMPTTGVAETTATIPSPPPPPSATLAARANVYKAWPLALKKAKAALTATRLSQRAAVLAKKRGMAATGRSASTNDSTLERL